MYRDIVNGWGYIKKLYILYQNIFLVLLIFIFCLVKNTIELGGFSLTRDPYVCVLVLINYKLKDIYCIFIYS